MNSIETFRSTDNPTIFSLHKKTNLQRLFSSTVYCGNTQSLTIITKVSNHWSLWWVRLKQQEWGHPRPWRIDTSAKNDRLQHQLVPLFERNRGAHDLSRSTHYNNSTILKGNFPKFETSLKRSRTVLNFLYSIGMPFPIIGGPLHWTISSVHVRIVQWVV